MRPTDSALRNELGRERSVLLSVFCILAIVLSVYVFTLGFSWLTFVAILGCTIGAFILLLLWFPKPVTFLLACVVYLLSLKSK